VYASYGEFVIRKQERRTGTLKMQEFKIQELMESAGVKCRIEIIRKKLGEMSKASGTI